MIFVKSCPHLQFVYKLNICYNTINISDNYNNYNSTATVNTTIDKILRMTHCASQNNNHSGSKKERRQEIAIKMALPLTSAIDIHCICYAH